MGNKVEAMLYRTDVDLFKNSLSPNETYLISNAVVWPVNPGFKNPLVDNNYQWIISAKTAILPTEERAFVSSDLAPVFICYDHFHRLIGTPSLISTMAVIIGKHEPRTVLSRGRENTLREYVAIDEASITRPFVITFWNDAIPEHIYNLLDSSESRHVIAALNFRVTNYHGLFGWWLVFLRSLLLAPIYWFKVLAKEFHWSIVSGVIIMCGASQGLGGSLARVGTQYYMKDVQRVQPSEAQIYWNHFYSLDCQTHLGSSN
ncbi:hypothetical protein OROMI_004295 [Orobanche minor]